MSAQPSFRDILDKGPWTGFQKRAALLAILAVVLDGFDIQVLGVAIPMLIKAWGVPREAFVPVLGLGLVAMGVGTAVSGWLGDRIGRKVTLVASMVVFGIGTLAGAMASGMSLFLVSRIVASIGLGGAMPSAVALLSEYTPIRRRARMVTLGMICTPLGGVMAGLVSAWLLPIYGWRSLFVVGGLLPLLLALVITLALPESPQFLSTHPSRRAELERVGRRMGVNLEQVSVGFAASGDSDVAANVGYRALLAPGERLASVLLWVQFLGVLTAAYTVFNWLPTLSVELGLDTAAAGTLLAAFNFGGIAGAAAGALVIDRLGSRQLTIGYAGAAVVACLLVIWMFSSGVSFPMLAASIIGAGVFIAGLQPMLFAVAANAYNARVRTTGVGAALAIGRLGAIASSYIGAVLIGGGSTMFFLFLCAMMLIVTGALWLMPRHVAGSGGAHTGV